MKHTDTVQRILIAAIDIAYLHGTETLTTRGIAEAAGVNVAAVNYHFGSKSNLIRKVLELTMDSVVSDWEMIQKEESRSLPKRVFLLIDYLMEGVVRYPGLAKSYIFDHSVNNFHRVEFTKRLDSLLRNLSTVPDVRLAMGQCIISAIAAAMTPEIFTMLTGGPITSEISRREYILALVNSIPGLEISVTPSLLETIAMLRIKSFGE